MAATKHNIVIEEGAVFRKAVYWRREDETPYDVTGYEALFQIRAAKSPTSPVLLSAATSGYSGDADGYITIDGPDGQFTIVIEADVTEAARGSFDEAFYDLKLYPSGFAVETDTIRLMEGRVRYSNEVTDKNNLPALEGA